MGGFIPFMERTTFYIHAHNMLDNIMPEKVLTGEIIPEQAAPKEGILKAKRSGKRITGEIML